MDKNLDSISIKPILKETFRSFSWIIAQMMLDLLASYVKQKAEKSPVKLVGDSLPFSFNYESGSSPVKGVE